MHGLLGFAGLAPFGELRHARDEFVCRSRPRSQVTCVAEPPTKQMSVASWVGAGRQFDAGNTMRAYNDTMKRTRDSGRLQVVMFHANHCRSCKAAKAKFLKMMEGDQYSEVDYTLLDVSSNTAMNSMLGIENLPTFHFYVGKNGSVGILDEMECGGFGCADRIRKRLDRFSGDSFDVNEYEF